MKFFGSLLLAVFAATAFYLWGLHGGPAGTGIAIVKTAEAAGGVVKSPTGTAPDRYVYLATLPSQPGKINVHEFDYKGENQVVYEKNGVTIKSWPAIHAGDEAVSFALYWKGLKVVIGGDTKPNTWYIKYAKDADVDRLKVAARKILTDSAEFRKLVDDIQSISLPQTGGIFKRS